ncbi:MAG: hypothetical protein ACOC1U_07275 [Spirochaetota bacterium]
MRTPESLAALHNGLLASERPARRRIGGRLARSSSVLAMIVSVAGFLSGCSLPLLAELTDPPLEYEHVELVEADRGSLHARAGLYLVFRNRRTTPIRSITIAFDLYDDEGVPVPAPGANAFSATFPVVLDAHERGAWCVSLDTPAGGSGGLRLARLRLLEAVFADGSSWWVPGGHLMGDPPPESAVDGGAVR